MFFYALLFLILDLLPLWLLCAGGLGIGLSALSGLVVGVRALFGMGVSRRWANATLALFLVSATAVGIGLAFWGKTNPARNPHGVRFRPDAGRSALSARGREARRASLPYPRIAA